MCLISCKRESNDAWVVKYKDFTLAKSELNEILPQGLSAEDSINFVNLYIKKWVKTKVLISEKENLLSDEELLILERKIEKYREDLTANMIEDKWVLTFNDSIREDEMMQYYKDVPDTFILKNDVLSYRIMEIPTDSLKKFRELLRNNEMEKLEKKLKELGSFYDFKLNNWIEKEKLLSTDILPEKIKKHNLMIENQIITDAKNDNTIVFQTLEFGKSGSPAPYSYIKPTIKSVLLNKRKLNLLSQKKNELYDKALENDEIKRK
ncbi:MAG: hypothetical protein Q4G27_01890 [Flavobacteriaceae bacterium]|nr:hypothetical protein [Flavobacteriaceae bacterium]